MSSGEGHKDWNERASASAPEEDAFWRQNYATRPYAAADRGYDFYRPAYRYGWESAHRYRGQDWNSVESNLRSGWDQARGSSTSTWDQMKDAIRDGWDRMTHAFSHDKHR